MSLALRAVVVLVVAFIAVSCVGDPTDEEQIEEVMRDFFAAFEDGDSERMASFFGELCEDMQQNAIAAIDELEQAGGDVEFNLNSVDVRNVEEGFAEALPIGTVSVGGETSALSNPDDEYTRFVFENDEWRIAECNLFL